MITALTALFTVLCLTSASNDILSSTGTSFGVGLTTIPPRFSSVHHVVRSWLQQDYPPAVIVIFLPMKYSVFPNGVGKRKNKNFLALEGELMASFPVEMEEKRVVIQIVHKDFGPLTKYFGMLEFFSVFDNDDHVIDQWVIGDDDVKYAPSTLRAYVDALQQTAAEEGVPAIMTHFDVHARLKVLLDDVFYPIAHFQVRPLRHFGLCSPVVPHHNTSISSCCRELTLSCFPEAFSNSMLKRRMGHLPFNMQRKWRRITMKYVLNLSFRTIMSYLHWSLPPRFHSRVSGMVLKLRCMWMM